MPVDRADGRAASASCGSTTTGRVAGFLEKPKTDEELDIVRTDPAWIDARGIASRGRDCLASMGIYLFNRDTLVDAARRRPTITISAARFFPPSIRTHRVQVHLFDGYWEDIGTIRSFYEANLALAGARPAVRPGLGRRRRSTPGPASCPPRGSTARRSATA